MLFYDSAKLLLTELNASLGTSYTDNDVTWGAPFDSAQLPGGATAFVYNTGIVGTIAGTDYFINYKRVLFSELFLQLPVAYQKLRLLNHESGKINESIALSIATQWGFPITGADIDTYGVALAADGLSIRFRISDYSVMYKTQWISVTLKVFTTLNSGKFYSLADVAAIHPQAWSQDVTATDTAYTKADPAQITSRYDYTPIRGVLKHLRANSDMTVNAWISDARQCNRLINALTSVDGSPWVYSLATTKAVWNIAGSRVVYNGKVSDLTPAKSMAKNIPKNMLPLIKPTRSGFTHVLILRLGSSGVTQTAYGISNMLADCAILHYNA